MNYVSKENMADILTGIARKIGNSSDNSRVVAEQEILYEGTELITDMTLNTVYQISDITGYDFLILTIEAQLASDSAYRYIQTELIKTPQVDSSSVKYRYDFNYNSQGFNSQHPEDSFGGLCSFNDATHIRFAPRTCGSNYSGICLKKIEGIKFVSSSSRENNYSTEEQRIGTWIDGKPLYQKTFLFDSRINVSSENWTQSSISILDNNIKSIIDVNGFVFNNITTKDSVFAVYPLLCSVNTTAFSNVAFLTPRNAINDSIDGVTLQYTKTTDGGGGT